MSWRTVRLDQVAPTPWKNGGGTTRELAAWPDNVHWVWRMSVAEVAQSGPFSRFEGVQRWFAVLSGAGVRLMSDGQRRTLTPASEPFSFDGAALTDCELIDGPTQDFNLMARQTGARAQMLRISKLVNRQLGGLKWVALYAIESRATVGFNGEMIELEPSTLAWRPVTAGDQIQINSTSALLIEVGDEIGEETREGPGT